MIMRSGPRRGGNLRTLFDNSNSNNSTDSADSNNGNSNSIQELAEAETSGRASRQGNRQTST